jgi:hypothetical protein
MEKNMGVPQKNKNRIPRNSTSGYKPKGIESSFKELFVQLC